MQDGQHVAPGLAGAAVALVGQRQGETGVDAELPQAVVERTGLDALAHALVDLAAEQALHRVLDQRIVAGGHRRSSPFAMMPRRISRVPPRSENDGAASV